MVANTDGFELPGSSIFRELPIQALPGILGDARESFFPAPIDELIHDGFEPSCRLFLIRFRRFLQRGEEAAERVDHAVLLAGSSSAVIVSPDVTSVLVPLAPARARCYADTNTATAA